MKIVLTRLKCKRCGHGWYPKSENMPMVCPKCKSPYWAIPKKTKKEKR